MGRENVVSRLAVVAALVVATGGCAVFGGGRGEEVGSPSPSVPATDQPSSAAPPGAATSSPDASLEDLLLTRDYAGVLAVFAADSSLHTEEDGLYAAGLAAAMSGHAGHDPRRAARLFRRLLELHPETERRPEVDLYLEMIARERDLRRTIDRLDRELRQLKAIDLGEQPEEVAP